MFSKDVMGLIAIPEYNFYCEQNVMNKRARLYYSKAPVPPKMSNFCYFVLCYPQIYICNHDSWFLILFCLKLMTVYFLSFDLLQVVYTQA